MKLRFAAILLAMLALAGCDQPNPSLALVAVTVPTSGTSFGPSSD